MHIIYLLCGLFYSCVKLQIILLIYKMTTTITVDISKFLAFETLWTGWIGKLTKWKREFCSN